MKNKEDNQTNWIIGIVVLIASFFIIASFSGYGTGGMMGMMYGNYGYGMMFFGWFFGVLILIALILFIMWLIKEIQKK